MTDEMSREILPSGKYPDVQWSDNANNADDKETDDRPAVFTSMPLASARVGMQWRIAFVNVLFPDVTWGILPIACAPLVLATAKELRDMAAWLLLSAQTQHHLTKDVALFEESPKQGVPFVLVQGIAEFARVNPLEYSAFYFDMSLLERLVLAYEVIPAHSVSDCLAYEWLMSRYGQITPRIQRKTGLAL